MARYADLTREELVVRLAAYESAGPAPAGPSKSAAPAPVLVPAAATQQTTVKKSKGKAQEPFQFGAAATRHIALLVSYHGWPYSGLAIQPTSGYPTVEGELLKALEKTRLVEEGAGWEGCEFSRCGRTDRGVSGEGQVLNLWVRSVRSPNDGGNALGDAWRPPREEKVSRKKKEAAEDGEGEGAEPPSPKAESKKAKADKGPPVELNYPRLLNSVLPPAIRILAWSPAAADFDARFSCSYRHYKYSFHRSSVAGTTPLDLDLMNEGATLLLGEHDYRNFCRLDGSKQIENHSRCVLKAYFEPGPLPGQIIFNLIGTAFLWHQVRHIIAILFLIGAKFEPPTLVTDLLDVTRFPGKPQYAMGAPIPLTLHECGYPADAGLDWRYGPYDGAWQVLPAGEEKEKVRALAELGRDNLERQLDADRQEAETRAWQVGGALRRARDVLGPSTETAPVTNFYPTGAGEYVTVKNYHHVVNRPVSDGPDIVNAKWRENNEKKLEERRKAEEKEQEGKAE
jgi:tRNA pseudouridine38/39 synthase